MSTVRLERMTDASLRKLQDRCERVILGRKLKKLHSQKC